jgi:threonine dehydrogenase-like Zn-dependent dehydrogenase
MRDHKLVVDEIAAPEPREGEVLVRTLACGICGSDLHALKHTELLVEGARRSGGPFVMDPSRDIVMGHEFCAEIVDFGPRTARTLKPGSRVCSIPIIANAQGIESVGYSNDNPGGYGELMRLSEDLLLPVPDAVSTAHAACVEPMAVGVHAVAKARLENNDVPLVIGCGPVGLAVIAALRLADARPIVAADFSGRRRELALAMGADIVVDPAVDSPYTRWAEVAPYPDPASAPPRALWLSGPALRPAVIFECVGVPGVIEAIMTGAPANARVVVVGVCMERDCIEPMFGINKELNLQFVLGYSSEEFTDTLRWVGDGKIPVEPLLTGTVGIEGVAGAFAELASPEHHAKILVEPWHS